MKSLREKNSGKGEKNVVRVAVVRRKKRKVVGYRTSHVYKLKKLASERGKNKNEKKSNKTRKVSWDILSGDMRRGYSSSRSKGKYLYFAAVVSVAEPIRGNERRYKGVAKRFIVSPCEAWL